MLNEEYTITESPIPKKSADPKPDPGVKKIAWEKETEDSEALYEYWGEENY